MELSMPLPGDASSDRSPNAILQGAAHIVEQPATGIMLGVLATGSAVGLYAMDPNAVAMAVVTGAGGLGAVVVTVYTSMRKADKEAGVYEIKKLNDQVRSLRRALDFQAKQLESERQNNHEIMAAQVELLRQVRENAIAARVTSAKTEEHAARAREDIDQVKHDTKLIRSVMGASDPEIPIQPEPPPTPQAPDPES